MKSNYGNDISHIEIHSVLENDSLKMSPFK